MNDMFDIKIKDKLLTIGKVITFVFGDKYKEIDFTEANVVAAKSKVEEEMNFSDKKITRKISKPQNKSVFKEIAFEENGLPYEEEEQEV